jgi:selenocysteine-specific elongation factor
VHVLATAGHVDHGKSTLVRELTGVDPDRLDEEKQRGLTIDLGFAPLTLPSGRQASFIDVPGHVRFLRNMLAGVGAVDACLFVVAATEGWKPQSEEHLRILELLGIRHGVVALTKVGVADDDLRELARMELEERLAGSFLEDAPIVEVDAPTGIGMDDLRAALDDLLVATPTAADRGKPRLWVDRAFAARGAGTIVTGTLTGGRLRVDDELELHPQGVTVRVRGLQSHHERRTKISPGARVAVNLVGIDHDAVTRGDVLVRPGDWHLTRTVDASLTVLDGLDHAVSRRGAHVLYLGAGEFPVRMRILGPAALEPGSTGAVRIHLPVALPLLPGDRFVLRESGRSETVGGGEVLDVAPRLPASRAVPDRSVDRVIRERGWVEADELERLTGERRPGTIGTWVVDPEVLAAARADVSARVDGAGPLGLDVAALGERERAVLALLPDIDVVDGRARVRDAADPLAGHPFLDALAAAPFTPPAPDGLIGRDELRQLVRRGEVVEQDGVFYSPAAVDAATLIVADLLDAQPDGFTVADFRDRAGNSRKHALPLLARLDATGVTRRRGDLRIAGPRLGRP